MSRGADGSRRGGRWVAAPALLLATAAAAALWAWLGRAHDMPDVPGGRLDCLSYAPYDGGAPPPERKLYRVSQARIDADLAALAKITRCVRTYSARGPEGAVATRAGAYGIKVLQGVWISGEKEEDAAEIAAGLALAANHPETVRALVVGNEVLLRRELTADELGTLLRAVKRASRVPITYADIYEFWRRSPGLAASVDFVTVHILPHWDDPAPVGIDRVQDHVDGIVARVRESFPNSKLMIGETGWPSAGRSRGGAEPSRVNQARFVRGFAARAAGRGIDYNLIEAIDQPWKRRPEGTVGGHWGVLDTARLAKFPLAGPVSEWPRWPLALGISTAVALGLVVLVLAGARRPSGTGWLALAGLGQILGTMLVFQADFVHASAETPLGWGFGLYSAALGLAAAWVLVPLLDGTGGGTGGRWRETPPATLAATLAWLRRPRRATFSPALVLGALHVAAAVPAAYFCLTLAADPRHRDIPLSLFALPAAAVAILFMVRRRGQERLQAPPQGDQREEAWLAIVLALGGALALDGWENTEAMAWLGIALALAVPWAAAVGGEARRLGRWSAEAGGAQQRDQDARRRQRGVV